MRFFFEWCLRFLLFFNWICFLIKELYCGFLVRVEFDLGFSRDLDVVLEGMGGWFR